MSWTVKADELSSGDMVIMETKSGQQLHGDLKISHLEGGTANVWLNSVFVKNVPLDKMQRVSSSPAWEEIEWEDLP